MTRAAVRPFVRYAASQPLRLASANGNLTECPLSTWTVTDDWPERVPVTSVEVDVFEAWFGDVFDELFRPCQ
jgi:hypothetical protein